MLPDNVLTRPSLFLFVFVTGAIFLTRTAMRARKALRQIHNWPGYQVLFTTRYALSALIPFNSVKYIYREAFGAWKDKHSEFAKHGVDIISGLHVFPRTHAVLLVADASVIKHITSNRLLFPKPPEQYDLLTFYGDNIVASEGKEWKRHKKISAPAFSEPNNRMVRDETCRIMQDLFDNVWGVQQEIVVDHVMDITLPIALFTIGSAGFGRRMGWEDVEVAAQGHQLAFKEALHILISNIMLKLITPDWLLRHGSHHMKNVSTAYRELKDYMMEMIRDRQNLDSKQERHDLFSSLLCANGQDGETTLTDDELIGNIFLFLVAGYDTTATTLCFALALLALYQDEQEKLYQQVQSIVGSSQVPTYEDVHSLTYCLAVLYETLRLFPLTPTLHKFSSEDTTLSTVNIVGETVTVPVPAGTRIMMHLVGLHYNPRYWSDPYAFKPSRFLGDWPRDAFIPFSEGARSCLGRRFFEVEGIIVIAMLISRYKVEVNVEPEFSGETFEERKKRILRACPGLILTPTQVPLVFRRRSVAT